MFLKRPYSQSAAANSNGIILILNEKCWLVKGDGGGKVLCRKKVMCSKLILQFGNINTPF